MFYTVNSDGNERFQYVWKDLSFGGFVRSTCQHCGRDIVTACYEGESHQLLLEGGKHYPDILRFHGAGTPLFIVTDRVLALLEQHRISGISGNESVTISAQQGENIVPLENAPSYHLLHIGGKIELDFSSMFLKKKRKCKSCGQFEWNRQRLYPLAFNLAEWDGSDLCRIASLPGHVVCSEKMAQVINQYSLTGVQLAVCQGR